MKNKKILFIVIIILLGTILYSFDFNLWLLVLVGIVIVPIVYALWEPPKKHKQFSYSDQQKATFRALGGSGFPDLPKPEIRRDKKKKNI